MNRQEQAASAADSRAACESGGEEEKAGSFAGFILLKTGEWDFERFRRDLSDDWGVDCPREALNEDASKPMVWEYDGMTAAVSLIPAPVPDGEAQRCASRNYMWREAAALAATHEAHLIAAVLPNGRTAEGAGKLFVKICAACLKQENALGVYASGTVFEPAFYLEAADMMRDGGIPVLNLVFTGLYSTEEGMNAYTCGMSAFGKKEMEVIGCGLDAAQLRDFMMQIVHYVLTENVVLQDGETIGFSEEEKLPITLSEGAAVPGESLKIGV